MHNGCSEICMIISYLTCHFNVSYTYFVEHFSSLDSEDDLTS